MAQKNKKAAWADCCENWGGYMAAKKAKLEEQFQEAAQTEFSDPSSLFSGIAIFVNGYTNPTADELKRIMMAHGGVYHHYLRPQGTTHLIASNLPYSKIIAYRKAKNPLPLCKPEWITDSINEGKLLDFRNYLLYSQCTKTQPSIFTSMTKSKKFQSELQSTSNHSNIITSNSTNTENSETIYLKKEEPTTKETVTLNSEVPSAIANCTKNPEFLTEFYQNSRLHHISTMGATFKEYINELRDKSDGKFSGLDALKKQTYVRYCKPGPSSKMDDSGSDDDLFNNNECALMEKSHRSISRENNKIIMHIDMDCFFVSVGLRKHPELKGFPIAVAHAKGNKQTNNGLDEYGSMSEVASCSYEARKAGVKNGMLLGQALKLCPNLKTIRYDFEGYKEVSYSLYDTVASYTLNIEAVSCDEMYADCSNIIQTTGLTPLEFSTIIRNEIKQKTGCPVSTGFGENKLQARLATKKAKPDGQYYLKSDSIRTFIRTLSVRDLPGVGYSTSDKLHQMNVRTCADLETISLYELQKEFGKKNGQQLYDMCRGIDHSQLNLEHVRKSVSAEVNYGIRFENNEAAHEFLKKLSIEVSDRLKKIHSKGKCITLKVLIRVEEAPIEPKKFMGCGLCDAFNKSKNLIASTDDAVIITREAICLWNQLQKDPVDARGIGIQITKLESLRNKSNASTLLRFFTEAKVQNKNTNNIEAFNNNSDKQENKVVIINKNVENAEEYQNQFVSDNLNNIRHKTCNKDYKLISEQIESDCDNINFFQNKTSNQNNVTNEDSTSHDEVIQNFISPLGSEEIAFGDEYLGNFHEKDQTTNVIAPEKSLKNSSQLKQTTQPQFFKQIKSSANRHVKVKMPDIQEIDMKVLIELPEDIRNEILNEYKKNTSNEQSNDNITHKFSENNGINRHASTSNNLLERDLSFSQIDPEVLAALPEDVKNEVKSYCDIKRKEKSAQTTKKSPSDIVNKGWNMFKNEKKIQKNTKFKNGKLKITKSGTKKESKSNVPSKINKVVEMVPSKVSLQKQENNVCIETKIETLKTNTSFHFDRTSGNPEHSEILSSLVNCLLDLPISKIKQQIRDWIVNNTDVNDVDFLTFTTYLGTLPRKRRLVDLHTLLKCLHRIITNSQSCVWHDTYKKMLKHIQTRMRMEYEHELMIPQQIDCDKCKTV